MTDTVSEMAVAPMRSTSAEAPRGVEFLTTEEVAAKLRTTPETCRYWRHISKGPKSFKVGRRVLYAREDVEAFIAEARSLAEAR